MPGKLLGGHSAALHYLDPSRTKQIRRALLLWYAESARILPWRVPAVSYSSSDYKTYVDRLYRCIISETMLQQTQVKTVIAYYTKWLEQFPTIEELANASEEDVMACWAGLGYYSRAKRLHLAAQYLVEHFVEKMEEFPRDPEYWIKQVPGVGPYTAGAILSISFDIPSAIIDGNVQRVLSRVLAVHGDTSTPKSAGTKLLWQRAAELVQGDQPGALNQSLMELGATICTPTLPSCSKCPIAEHCTARQNLIQLKSTRKSFFSHAKDDESRAGCMSVFGDIEDLCTICPSSIDVSVLSEKPETYIQNLYPFKPQKKAQREENSVVIVIRQGTKVYLEKKAKGLLAGLYDFPTIVLAAEDDVDEIILKHKKKLKAKDCGSTIHLFSHIRRTSHVLCCGHEDAARALEAFKAANDSGKWVEEGEFATFAVSELFLKNWRCASGDEELPRRQKRRTVSTPSKTQSKRSKSDSKSNCTTVETATSSPVTGQSDETKDLKLVKVFPSTTGTKQNKFFALFERKARH